MSGLFCVGAVGRIVKGVIALKDRRAQIVKEAEFTYGLVVFGLGFVGGVFTVSVEIAEVPERVPCGENKGGYGVGPAVAAKSFISNPFCV